MWLLPALLDMSEVIHRTISSVSKSRCVLQNSQDARPLVYGGSWTSLRIGLLFHARNIGANIIGTPRFAFGVVSGTSQLFGDGTTSHFVGIRSNAATWTLTGANRFLVPAGSLVGIKKVGTTVSSAASAFFLGSQWGVGALADSNGADRTALFVDITKGSPNYTIQIFGWNNTGTAPADVSGADFLIGMTGTPAIPEHVLSEAVTIAVDEVDGVLNTVCWHWDRTDPQIEIEHVAINRLD